MESGSRSDTAPNLLDRPDVLEVLFHPAAEHAWAAGPPDLMVPVDDDVALAVRVFPAEAASPMILLFHGNGELASDYRHIASRYNKLGITLVVADYRGYGASQGAPTSSALLRDAKALYHHAPPLLEELGLDCGRMFIMGRSLGSAAAIEIASNVRHKLQGLIVESGFAYTFPLIQRLGGPILAQADEKRDGFDNTEKMERVTIPTLVIHGERDHIIPVSEGKALHRHGKARSKSLVLIPHAGHNDLMQRGRDQYFEAIRDFVAA
jgi:alpha-beta hydrolase superfamily lysophospholipase